MKTTWILGAGFSRPLGGKLLPDLFDTSCAPLAASAFPDLFYEESEQINATLALYRDHLAMPEKVDLMRLWRGCNRRSAGQHPSVNG